MSVLKKSGLSLLAIVVIAAALFLTKAGQGLIFKTVVYFQEPATTFDGSSSTPAPDYSEREFWAALPEMEDPADLFPEGVDAIRQGEGAVDTFFIHPTGYLNSATWISPMDKNSGTEENTRWMLANQASAYNGCCNVYAPRYREATIFSYFQDKPVRDALLGFAYQDVKTAFEYYLANFNEGRPFIIASHSQGTHHAKRLLKEVIDNSDLHQRMVAAYIIGAVNIAIAPAYLDSMPNIGACQNANDLHCIVHWDTVRQGTEGPERDEPSLCTNPLTWMVNNEFAQASANDGAVVPEGNYMTAFGSVDDEASGQVFSEIGAPIPDHVGAQCQNDSLHVADQKDTVFGYMAGGADGSYHGLDYALFYMNIRNNARLRVATYLENRN